MSRMQGFFYKSIFALLLYSAFACLICLAFPMPRALQVQEFIYPFILLAYAAAIYQRRARYSSGLSEILRGNFDTLAVFAFLLLLRLYFIDQVSIWLDEDYQANLAWNFYPLGGALRQHQPPGDMVFTKVGLILSGFSVTGYRLHTAVFSALAGAMLYFGSKRLSGSRAFAALSALFFCFHFLVFRYGYEGRPLSYGIMLELLFVLIICEFEKSQIDPLLVSATTFLFLCSCGLQPVFVVGIFSLWFAWNFFRRRGCRSVLQSLLSGAAAFLPIQALIVMESPPRFAIMPEAFSFEKFFALNTFFFPMGILAIAGAIVTRSLRKSPSPPAPAAFLLFVTAGFALALVPFFSFFIKWPFHDYYAIFLLPLIFLLLSCVWAETGAALRSTPVRRSLLFTLFIVTAPFYDFVGSGRKLSEGRPDMKGAFDVIKSDRKANDLTLSFCIAMNRYCPQWAIGRAFYLPEEPPESGNDTSPELYVEALRAGKKPENVYFILQENWSQKSLGEKFLLARPAGAPVYRIPVNGTLAETMIAFMEPLVKEGLREDYVHAEAVSYLVASYQYLGDTKKRNFYLSLYKNRLNFRPQDSYLNRQLGILPKEQ